LPVIPHQGEHNARTPSPAPDDLCGRFKQAGLTWIHKCVGLRYAQKIEAMGADVITVVGYENG
jgi:nitronate monooxygenase